MNFKALHLRVEENELHESTHISIYGVLRSEERSKVDQQQTRKSNCLIKEFQRQA